MTLLEKLSEMMSKNIEVKFEPELKGEVVRITSLHDGKFVDTTMSVLDFKLLRNPEEPVVSILDTHQDLLMKASDEDILNRFRKEVSKEEFERDFWNKPNFPSK